MEIVVVETDLPAMGSEITGVPLTEHEKTTWRALAKCAKVFPLPGVVAYQLVLCREHIRVRVLYEVVDVDPPHHRLQIGEGRELDRRWFAQHEGEELARKALVAELRRCLIDAYIHEVDESIRWADGTHVRNPHMDFDLT